jgi:hypothetical protein
MLNELLSPRGNIGFWYVRVNIDRILRAPHKRGTTVPVVSAALSNCPHNTRLYRSFGKRVCGQGKKWWSMTSTFAWSCPMRPLFMVYFEWKHLQNEPPYRITVKGKHIKKILEVSLEEFLRVNSSLIKSIESVCMYRDSIFSTPYSTVSRLYCLCCYLTRIGKILYRLVLSHATTSGRRAVGVAWYCT